MLHSQYSDRLSEAVIRAAVHWESVHRDQTPLQRQRRGLTIAISRQSGTAGEAIARAVGSQMNWPVFDHELLRRIADEMQVRIELLESVDERHQSWLLESIEALAPNSTVSETSYLRHMVETICSLAAHGHCVIVGRGAAQFLPQATTLRVRIVAPPEDRIATVQAEQKLTHRQAERIMTTRERQRIAFVKEHFHKDPTLMWHYDLVLNTHQLSLEDCAELIVVAAKMRDERTSEHSASRPATAAQNPSPAGRG